MTVFASPQNFIMNYNSVFEKINIILIYYYIILYYIKLYGDWYIFTNKEPRRFHVFMKTVSTDRNKDELSFELFSNQFHSPVFEKNEKKFEKLHFTA